MDLLDHKVVCFIYICFLRKLHTVSIVFYQLTFPSTVYKVSLFLTSTLTFVICRFLNVSYSPRWEEIFHCGFDLQLSDD